MLRHAIPEGVINPGGHVAGYLYFQKLPKSASNVQFTMRLEGARSHRQFGTIQIPFEKKS